MFRAIKKVLEHRKTQQALKLRKINNKKQLKLIFEGLEVRGF